jgi:hypothetical protein
MKVKIGKYVNWIGPYQIVDAVFFWQERYPPAELESRWDYKLHDRLSEWLAKTWVADFCEWIHKHKKRKIVVKLDPWDTWSVDHTLALIIAPLVKQLRDTKSGYGWIADEDVPEELRSDKVPAKEYGNWDDNAEKRFEYVLNEIIWTFECLASDNDGEDQFYDHSESNNPNDDLGTQISKLKVDRDGLKAHWERINNGTRLFGKYYRNLWD